jgi:MYXO-CTERM domain-containing protein
MMTRTILAGLAGLAVAAPFASANTIHEWTWFVGDTGVSQAGGAIEYVRGRYNNVTQQFRWDMTFSDTIADGYTLAVSPGPNPKGISGELALIHFDAVNTAAPIVNVFSYNGLNALNSWRDGSEAPGEQAPDRVASSIGINSAAVLNAWVSDDAGKRSMTLILDGSIINAHAPAYPGSEPWTGVAFGEQIGIWLHPVTGLTTNYIDGFLCQFEFRAQGWLDLKDRQTTLVPNPGVIALAGLGGLAAARRRRG